MWLTNSMKSLTYKLLRQLVRSDTIHETMTIWTYYTASNALFSRLIRWFTRSNYSHVGFLVYFYGRLWTVEMMEGKGCVLTLASVRFKKEKIVTIWPIKNQIEPQKFIASLLEDVGYIPYDLKWALLAPFLDTKSWQRFCSEWATQKIPLDFPGLDRGIFPSDVMAKCGDIYLLSE